MNRRTVAEESFNTATSNGCREMTFERFLDALDLYQNKCIDFTIDPFLYLNGSHLNDIVKCKICRLEFKKNKN